MLHFMSFSSLSHSKMFDIELCPLPFSMEEMFGFISCRFSGYPASVQEQALLWLHVSARARSHIHTCTHTRTHRDSFSCVQLVSCGSVHGECEVNRLSQSVRVWAGARAEHGSGSQRNTKRERDRRDFVFQPICSRSLQPCEHGSVSSFLTQPRSSGNGIRLITFE